MKGKESSEPARIDLSDSKINQIRYKMTEDDVKKNLGKPTSQTLIKDESKKVVTYMDEKASKSISITYLVEGDFNDQNLSKSTVIAYLVSGTEAVDSRVLEQATPGESGDDIINLVGVGTAMADNKDLNEYSIIYRDTENNTVNITFDAETNIISKKG